MNRRLTSCCRRSHSRGLTLIEVVAAIAILGTLLVGIVLAKSRHTRQLERARAQADAVQATDALIAGWWTDVHGVPIDERGEVPGRSSLRWRTRLIDNPRIEDLGARVVRVEVFADDDDDEAQRSLKPGEKDEALVVVDLVLPDPEVEAREQAEAEEAEEAEEAKRKAGGGEHD